MSGADKSVLLSVSYDGSLLGLDLRKNEKSEDKVIGHSVCMGEDLLSMLTMKRESIVVCSGSLGSIWLFKWGQFGDCCDIIRGHKTSVDAMLKINEDLLITGSEDGYLRAVSIYPN